MYWKCRKHLTACHMWFHSVAYLLCHQKLYPLKHCQNYFSLVEMPDVPFKSHIISFLLRLVQRSICSSKFLWRLKPGWGCGIHPLPHLKSRTCRVRRGDCRGSPQFTQRRKGILRNPRNSITAPLEKMSIWIPALQIVVDLTRNRLFTAYPLCL